MLTARGKQEWRIDHVARHVETPLSSQAADALATWLDTLAVWNARMDLTAAKTNDDASELMLTDALVLARHIPPGARVVDVGVGAGAPGLALALARPDLRVTLVEPLGKRVSFLRTVIGTLGRVDILLVNAKGESLAPANFDVAISRATLEPSEWLNLGLKLIRRPPPGLPHGHGGGGEAMPDAPADGDGCGNGDGDGNGDGCGNGDGDGAGSGSGSGTGSVWVLVASEEAAPVFPTLVSERFAYTLPFSGKSRFAVRFHKRA